MKALCVQQPWAELIASGAKEWEMRTWTTKYRGPILILASGQPSKHEDAKLWEDELGTSPLGVAICVVDLIDVVPMTCEGYSTLARCKVVRGQYGWCIRRPRRVPPVPVKGRLGLFEAPLDIVRAIGNHPETPLPVLEQMINTLYPTEVSP